MASLNKVHLIGNLGADAEVRQAGNSVVANFSVATTERWKDKDSGERKEHTEWHRIEVWGRQAEIAGEYLKKGMPVYVEGSLSTDRYDKDGVTMYSTKVKATNFQMLGGRGEAGHEG